MNCFQLIKTVLDELYQQIDESDNTAKDQAIKKELTYLQQQYRNLLSGSTIDYSNPVTRFAYIYKYVTSHANLVYTQIYDSPELRAIFDTDKARVTCIGGGPGSDLLGVLKYVTSRDLKTNLKFTLYDKEQSWNDSWSDVEEKLNLKNSISVICQSFDVTIESSWKLHNKYLNCDLFTMVYFLSEVYKLKSQADAYFTYLFQKAKFNALFLYIDNNTPKFYNWFDTLAARHKLMILAEGQAPLCIPQEEEKRDLGEYFYKFGPPKLTGDIAFRVCCKQQDAI